MGITDRKEIARTSKQQEFWTTHFDNGNWIKVEAHFEFLAVWNQDEKARAKRGGFLFFFSAKRLCKAF